MHFLRESLACLPTQSSIDEEGDQSTTGKKIAKWNPKEARKSQAKMNERFINVMEGIGQKIVGNKDEQKTEPSNEGNPFMRWVASEYDKLDPENQKALKRDITMAVTNYM